MKIEVWHFPLAQELCPPNHQFKVLRSANGQGTTFLQSQLSAGPQPSKVLDLCSNVMILQLLYQDYLVFPRRIVFFPDETPCALYVLETPPTVTSFPMLTTTTTTTPDQPHLHRALLLCGARATQMAVKGRGRWHLRRHHRAGARSRLHHHPSRGALLVRVRYRLLDGSQDTSLVSADGADLILVSAHDDSQA